MISRTMERLLWGASVLLIAIAAATSHEAFARPLGAPPVIWAIENAPAFPVADSLDLAARAVTSSDPFRLERRPSSIAYGAQPEGAPAAPAPPKPPKPPLALAGIVGGPPWVALLDGVPGRNGSVVVHAGDTLAGLRIRALGPRSVTIAGLDTTWKLTLKRPWQ